MSLEDKRESQKATTDTSVRPEFPSLLELLEEHSQNRAQKNAPTSADAPKDTGAAAKPNEATDIFRGKPGGPESRIGISIPKDRPLTEGVKFVQFTAPRPPELPQRDGQRMVGIPVLPNENKAKDVPKADDKVAPKTAPQPENQPAVKPVPKLENAQDGKSEPKIDRKPDAVAPKAELPKVDLKLDVTGHFAELQSGKVTNKETQLKDGTYKRNDAGQVVETIAPDGKTTRTLEYGDPKTPDIPTIVTMDGITYKRLSPSMSSGKPVEKEGRTVYGWTMYEGNQIKDHFYGSFAMSKNGVFETVDDKKQKDAKSFEGADKKAVTAEEAVRRDRDGIWPGNIDLTRPNGTGVSAKMEGAVPLEIKEKFLDKDKISERTWKKDGDKWVSDEKPAQTRRGVKVEANGDFTYINDKDQQITENKDVGRLVTDKAITTTYDPAGDITNVKTPDGERSITYGVNKDGVKQMTEIKSVSGDFAATWKRDGNSETWTGEKGSELRKDLKVTNQGDLTFVNDKDQKMQETSALSRIRFDDKDRPVEVNFVSGAKRTLDYDEKGLKSFRDLVQTDKVKQDVSWTRKEDGTGFESKRPDGKTYQRTDVEQRANGDVSYKGLDGKAHVSVARDLDRMSRGELILSAESTLEARNKLQDAVAASGLDQKRFMGWLKDFETRAAENKLPPEKIVKTMENLSEILTQAKDGPIYDRKQRETIVDTAMHNLGQPMEIDQGSHPTCNVTSVEVYAAVRHPDQYTRLLKEITATGKWKSEGGEIVTPPLAALTPGKDEKAYDLNKPETNTRNLASQVVQMTLVNGMYETGQMDKKDVSKKDWRYVMGPNQTKTEFINGQQIMTDLGEDVLIGKDGRPVVAPGIAADQPNMIQDHVVASGKMMFGEEPPFLQCSGTADIPDARGVITKQFFNYLPKPEEMLAYQKDNKMPILTPTMGGAHAQTIFEAWQDPKSKEVWVLLDNQHGEPDPKRRASGEGDGDGWIKLDVLHKTMKLRAQGDENARPVMPTLTKKQHPRDFVR